MQLPNVVRQRIINLAKDERINLKELSKRADMKYSTLESFMQGKTRIITVATLVKICEGFNMKLSEFFDDKLFNDVVDEYEKKN